MKNKNESENKNDEFQPNEFPDETSNGNSSGNSETKKNSNFNNLRNFFTTKRIVRAATIGALYALLTFASAFFGFAYGPIQFRISEALTILPLFFPEAIIGLAVGCFISNIFSSGFIILDLTLGTLATLTAAVLTFLIGKIIKNDLKIAFAILPPILINAFVVPFTFIVVSDLKEFYWISALQVGAGQAAVLIVLGIPLYFLFKDLINKNIIKK